MTVHDNIPRSRSMGKSIRRRSRRWSAKPPAGAHRPPAPPPAGAALAAGKAERCSARARQSCAKPKLFLLDEPLANLGRASFRLETRVELKRLQRNLNVTTIYVTHDQEEAMTLATGLAVFLESSTKRSERGGDLRPAELRGGRRLHRQPRR